MFSYQLRVKNRRLLGMGAWAAIFRDLALPPGIDVFLLTSYYGPGSLGCFRDEARRSCVPHLFGTILVNLLSLLGRICHQK